MNYGMNLPLWSWLGAFLFTLIFLILACRSFYRFSISKTRKKQRKHLWWTMGYGLIVFIMFVALFFAFGSGTPVKRLPTKALGTTEMMKAKPPEKSKVDIQKDAYDQKNIFLKRQDTTDADKEAREADEYLKKALKQKEEQNEN